MTETSSNLKTSSLPEYFRILIRGALEHKKQTHPISAPEAVEYYLVNLLQGCLSTNVVYPQPPEGYKEEPLAYILMKAVHAQAAARVQLLRRLGDFSLFISGFFPASLTGQLAGIDYYIQMGETAYGSLSQILGRRAAALREIFAELASRFVVYVDILSEVSEKSRVQNPADLLRLYEHWLKTGSERTAKLLSQAGILPVKAPHSTN